MLTPLGFSLLRQLADGAFHSGEDLAASVGLTRARVSQLLKQAETAGLSLERVRGLGIGSPPPPTFSTPTRSVGRCTRSPERVSRSRRWTSRSSTRSDRRRPSFLRRAQRRDIHGQVLAAEWQTAGRGRRGKAWTAVAGGSLTFSIGWRYEQGAGFLAGLSLAVGVAVVKALEAEGLGRRRAQVAERPRAQALKVGGILVELNGDALGPSTVVVGVGLNVRLPAEIRRNIEQPVSDLTTVAGRGAPADRPQSPARPAGGRARGDARRVLALGIPGVRRRVAAPPRLSRQAGEAAAPGRRQRQGHRGRRRQHRRARARRRPATGPLPLGRDLAAPACKPGLAARRSRLIAPDRQARLCARPACARARRSRTRRPAHGRSRPPLRSARGRGYLARRGPACRAPSHAHRHRPAAASPMSRCTFTRGSTRAAARRCCCRTRCSPTRSSS